MILSIVQAVLLAILAAFAFRLTRKFDRIERATAQVNQELLLLKQSQLQTSAIVQEMDVEMKSGFQRSIAQTAKMQASAEVAGREVAAMREVLNVRLQELADKGKELGI